MARYALSLPTQLKHEAEQWAAKQGVSLNQFILWAVAEKVGAIAAAGGFDAFGEEREEVVEGLSREIAVGMGAAKSVVEGVLFPGLGSASRDDLLHEDVGGLRGNL